MRYFFDYFDGTEFHVDDVGAEFSDPQAARTEAETALREMLRNTNQKPDSDASISVMHVRDDWGARLFTATLSLTTERLATPRAVKRRK
jgi:hypothetical protein